MEKELYYTNNKLISKLNIYIDVSPSQFNDIRIMFLLLKCYKKIRHIFFIKKSTIAEKFLKVVSLYKILFMSKWSV